MKQLILKLSLATGLMMGAGCYSVSSATSDSFREKQVVGLKAHPRGHVVVTNSGLYLFDIFPLVCGNVDTSSSCPWTFFHDEVTNDVIQNRLTAYADLCGCDVADLTFNCSEKVTFIIPGLSVAIPIPYILCVHDYSASGVLVDKQKTVCTEGGAQ